MAPRVIDNPVRAGGPGRTIGSLGGRTGNIVLYENKG